MDILFFVLVVVVSICLIGIILIQNSKGGGLASNIGVSNQMLGGVKKATDGVEKVTWGLAIALLLLCVCSGLFYNTASDNQQAAPKLKEVQAPSIPAGVQNQQSPIQNGMETQPNAPAE
jgi:preprotein translocase subunit SecG